MPTDRRQYERFAVLPAYTPCRIRREEDTNFTEVGHVHDVSEGGVRFEADIPIEPGTTIAIEIMLPERPGESWHIDGPGRAVFIVGNVIWCGTDEPGPAIMALATTRYARTGDRERLIRRLSSGGFARAMSA